MIFTDFADLHLTVRSKLYLYLYCILLFLFNLGSELKPEVQLSWSDNGRTTTITIKKVRNLKVDGSKTLPLGSYSTDNVLKQLKYMCRLLPLDIDVCVGVGGGGELKVFRTNALC